MVNRMFLRLYNPHVVKSNLAQSISSLKSVSRNLKQRRAKRHLRQTIGSLIIARIHPRPFWTRTIKLPSIAPWNTTAYLVHNDGGDLPSQPITISEFMLLIAELGGWQRKRSQGPPGSTTIWRGLRRMEAYADAFQAFKKAKLRCGG